MASELNMYESQVTEYKFEIERVTRDLQEVKKKYFIQKKREQQMRCTTVNTIATINMIILQIPIPPHGLWVLKNIIHPIELFSFIVL